MDSGVIDLYAFLRSGERIAGRLPLRDLPRLAGERAPLAEGPSLLAEDAAFDWSLEGWQRSEPVEAGGEPQLRQFLRLTIDGGIDLMCQRCLRPYLQALRVDSTLEVFRTDAEADNAAMDDDSADPIVGSSAFDLNALIEDELLLALPLAPKHEECPELPAALAESGDVGDAGGAAGDVGPSPFAALARLKVGSRNGSGS